MGLTGPEGPLGMGTDGLSKIGIRTGTTTEGYGLNAIEASGGGLPEASTLPAAAERAVESRPTPTTAATTPHPRPSSITSQATQTATPLLMLIIAATTTTQVTRVAVVATAPTSRIDMGLILLSQAALTSRRLHHSPS